MLKPQRLAELVLPELDHFDVGAVYLAHEISKYLPADQSLGANLMAHAVLGAVVGHFSGNATVGAISAFTAEAAAPAIIKAMGWDKDNLTEKQKQTVSALATLAAGLAGAAMAAVTGAWVKQIIDCQSPLQQLQKMDLKLNKIINIHQARLVLDLV